MPEAAVVTWRELGPGAKAFRVAHTAWALVSLASLASVWMAAVTGRRDRTLAASVAWLSVEGGALLVGRGDCPFGPFQARLGDPVPLFELALPAPIAKAAVPILSVMSLAGFGVVLMRWLRD